MISHFLASLDDYVGHQDTLWC